MGSRRRTGVRREDIAAGFSLRATGVAVGGDGAAGLGRRRDAQPKGCGYKRREEVGAQPKGCGYERREGGRSDMRACTAWT